MPVLHASLQGRFGNQTLQWLFCRALAERYNYTLHCEPWIGERVFDIPANPYRGPWFPRLNELTIFDQMERGISVEFRGYAQTMEREVYGTRQTQRAMPYTKRQAQEWLRIRPELVSVLTKIVEPFAGDSIVAHHRKGDFIGYSYPVVSRFSYQLRAHDYFGFGSVVQFVSEEQPTSAEGIATLPAGMDFLPDFYRLMMAPTLMRANSTFSFLAGLLSNGLVLSPRIDGLEGGREHDDVRFEAGNHCKLADFDFCSDLLVAP